jgi:hypothetical protein
MIMHHYAKKWVPLLAAMLLMAGTVPARAADERTAEQAASQSAASETAAQAADQETASPDSTSTQSAQQPEPVLESKQASGNVETLPESYNPFNWLLYKPLWALTGLIGDFNPIGKHVSDPLEEAVPGLQFKGFLNTITQINTTASTNDVGLGGRDKDWRLQKQEFRLQTEFKYQANDNIELCSMTEHTTFKAAMAFTEAESQTRYTIPRGSGSFASYMPAGITGTSTSPLANRS